ncbi:MAG: protein phosphatase 2C domain-containing protein [Gammaproteobacteria bacterium]|nr:protein phosphatase 2C domain-containing protein [Gammaproteobacteria bacterium]
MINSAQRTHTGYVRKHNEDSILTHPNYSLFVVADGMGGHSAGDLASQSIVNEILKLDLPEDDIKLSLEQIEDTLLDVNDKIHSGIFFDKKVETDGNDKSVVAGSTVVIAYIVDNICSCLWVGDSRLYIFRENKLYQITKDHSLVQEMIDRGQLTLEQAKSHPQTNVITRAIGVAQDVNIDINQFEIQNGDKLLLCSDGLYNEISSDIIIASLKEKKIDKVANKLLGEVLVREASDNISIIVIEKQ